MALSPEVEKLRDTAISEDEATSFFEERGIRLECELCGKVDWAISTEFKVSYLPMIAATCRNCGNMRLHNKIVMQIWKRDRAGNEQR